ncbi:MAG: HEAT repeat domain-containing protein [Rubripirellula sp.]
MSKVVMSRPMDHQANAQPSVYGRGRRSFVAILMGVCVAASSCLMVGCQDGPLYAIKAANPYYSMNEWKKDEAIGVTDHQRMQQLSDLADTIATLPANRQQFWTGQLKQMIENDQSPEMRRLAVRAAGALKDASSLALVEAGLDDESMKVRMEACESLGRRPGDEAARLLAATLGSETSQDVKHTAIEALAKHKSPIALDSLRVALADRNPATRDLAIASLRGVTGKNYGSNPDVWIAALDGKPTAEPETRIADRVRGLF